MAVSDVQTFTINYLQVLAWPVVVCWIILELLRECSLRILLAYETLLDTTNLQEACHLGS